MERRGIRTTAFGIVALGLTVSACSDDGATGVGAQTDSGAGGASGASGATTSGGSSGTGGTAAGGSSSGGSSGSGLPSTVPATFVDADTGGYALGPAIMGNGANPVVPPAATGCSVIVGVIRDFKPNEQGGHPDFEYFFNPGQGVQGLVEPTLGADGKPVYTGLCELGQATDIACRYGEETSTKANFDQWYRYVPNVNEPFLLYLKLAATNGGHSFQSSSFFPLDGKGWNDVLSGHNFSFTTELHVKFVFATGQEFTFTGDDDVWVFMNQHLAIDLGGVHAQASRTLDLDSSAAALGLAVGQEVSLDVFHAERHTTESNYGFETNIPFSDCGTVPADR